MSLSVSGPKMWVSPARQATKKMAARMDFMRRNPGRAERINPVEASTQILTFCEYAQSIA